LTIHNALVALVGIFPVLVFFDNALVAGLIAFCVAFALGRYVFTLRPGEASHLMTIIRWPAMLAALPLVLFIVQLIPIPTSGVSRSIWDSATSALNTPLWAGVSIDPGMTVIAMTSYLMAIMLVFVSAGLSIDRTNAERMLLTCAAVCAATALVLVTADIGGWISATAPTTIGTHAALVAGTAYGAVYCTCVAIMILERFETRRGRGGMWSNPFVMLAISTGGLAICFVAVLFAAANHATVAMTSGIATVAIIYVVRRLGFGTLAAITLTLIAIFAVATVIYTKGNPAAGDIAARYAAASSPELIASVSRVIGEVGLEGTGGGTFDAIYRLYGASAGGARTLPPTFAAQIAIEMGWPALWVFAAAMLGIVLLCVRGAFERGRDSFYSAAGAGVGVAAILLAFGDPSASNPAIMVLLASTFGLALAQSLSRRL
jgi:hypothetical protein